LEEPAVKPGWRKSSYGGNGGGGCVEVGSIPWRKSTYSSNGGAGCIEAAHVPGAVLVRDTQQFGAGPILQVTLADWRRFTTAIDAHKVLGLSPWACQRRETAKGPARLSQDAPTRRTPNFCVRFPP
jgi:hypothetical protein